MKRLLNTLYVTEPDLYLAADGNNIEILKNHERVKRIPLVNLEAIVTFGHQGDQSQLAGKVPIQQYSGYFSFDAW